MTGDTLILYRRAEWPPPIVTTAGALTAATVAHDTALAVLPASQHPQLDESYASTVRALLASVHYAARRAAA